VLISLSGCFTFQRPPLVANEPKTGSVCASDTLPPSIALALSGDSGRDFAHMSVIRVLEEAEIEPDLIVGSSAGSVVATAYIAGLNA
jgi:NTE family protein